MRRLIVSLVVVVCAALATVAHAGKLVVPDIHGEVDVEDEASVVSMLVRSALGRDTRTLVPIETMPVQPTLHTTPATLTKLGADFAILGELVREGTGLRITLVIVDRDGTSNVSLVRAGDGDVRGLAAGVLKRVTAITHIVPGDVPAFGLGRLRPYAVAGRLLRTDPTAAALALADAIPTTANVAPGATYGLHGMLGTLADPGVRLGAARSLAALHELDAIAANATGSVAAVARTLAAFERAKMADADEAIRTATGRDGLTLLARAILAEARGDAPAFAQLVRDTLATDQVRAMLAFASKPDAPRFTPELTRALLGFAEMASSPGVASRLGLAAVRANISVPRALALISIRDLDDAEIAVLQPLIASDNSPDVLRLRAELAMRRTDGTEGVAIDAYLAAAPTEDRAHLYQGYRFLSEDKYEAAAIEFSKADATRLRVHAQLLANDLQAAIATIAHAPATPEEHVVAARLALAESRLDDATREIAIAERDAPASPFVQRVIADLADQQNDKARAAVARTIADAGTAKVADGSGSTVKIVERTLGSSGGSAGGSGSGITTKQVEATDNALAGIDLRKLLDALPQLGQLANRRVALALVLDEPSLWSLRQSHPLRLRPMLVAALAAAPLRLLVIETARLDEPPTTTEQVARSMADADALLLYKVNADGGDAEIVLEVFLKGARTSRVIKDTVPGAQLVSWDFSKLVPLAIAVLLLILVGIYFVIRGTGHLKVVIERATDASDEVFCVAVTKSATRPSIGDPGAFRAAAKKAGSITKRRSATLIASGTTFRVPPGQWYAHVYGTHERGGVVMEIPSSASVAVKVKRNTVTAAEISLAPTTAELYIAIEGADRDHVAVWADQGERFYTNSDGKTVIPLAVGSHQLHFEVKGHTFTREVPTPQLRIYRFAINLTRELRLIEAGLDGTAGTSAPIPMLHTDELDLEAPNPHAATAAAQATAFLSAPSLAKEAGVRFGKKPEIGPNQVGPLRPIDPAVAVDDRLLGRYKRTAELGRGAMGVVWRAWDENLEREVAIKVMADDLQRNPEAMKLFSQEAKALAQLNHSNIVAVYDQVTVDSKAYLIMEFVDGATLESLLEARETFPWREAVDVADQLCAGLAYVHARRVIHRDIKPANIFIGADGVAKLGDFGLARVVRELTIRKTEIRGTPLYMAPEQILGSDIDHRADLYAVGCTLFELVIGHPPFIDGDILYHQLHGAPTAPSSLRADLPPELDQIILGLLAKSADDRPASATDVRSALAALKALPA